MIDLSTIESKLENFVSNKEKKLWNKQVILTPFQQKMDYLSDEYPRLYLNILEIFDMTLRIEEYLMKC